MDWDGMESEEWNALLLKLEEIIPHYERVNNLVTFSLVGRWRRRAAELAGPEEVVLEVGSGPGIFSSMLKAKEVHCLDPSQKMLDYSKRVLKGSRYRFVRGTAEEIPLDNETFDKAFCLFSFRDFFDKRAGLKEIKRVLKPGGTVVIVDVARAPHRLQRFIVDQYIRFLVPQVAKLAVPSRIRRTWKENPYKEFARTYTTFGTPEYYSSLLLDAGYGDISLEYLELNGAFLITGKKIAKAE